VSGTFIRQVLVSLIVLGWCAISNAQTPSKAQLEKRVDYLDVAIKSEMAREGVPGLTYAVVQHGKISKLGALGYGNLEWQARATNDTKFEVASVSKMIAGTAIRILIEEGKVGLDDPISKYLNVPLAWQGMTVRNLETMSSGFPEDWGGPTIPYDKDVVTPDDDESLLKSFETLKMVAPIGERFSYSSVNYAMLGMIISKVAGMSYADFVKNRIFTPAGMTATSVIDNAAVIGHRAEGYRKEGGQIKRGRLLGQYLHSRADDAILSTAQDYAKFIIALQERKIVKDLDAYWAASISSKGIPLDYSYGWSSATHLGHRRQQHSGGYRTGFHTFVARYPDDDLSIVVFTNCDFSRVRDYVNLISRKFLEIPDPEVESRRPDPKPEQTAWLKQTFEAIKSGKIDPGKVGPNALEPLGVEEFREFFSRSGAVSYAGARALKTPLHFHDMDLMAYETLKIGMGTNNFYLTFYLGRDGKVAYIEETN
jgi:CubicO group peptidase (beta-lactamase class C family)